MSTFCKHWYLRPATSDENIRRSCRNIASINARIFAASGIASIGMRREEVIGTASLKTTRKSDEPWIVSAGSCPLEGRSSVSRANLPPYGVANLRLTVEKEDAASDYERPGFEPSFLQCVPLLEGSALIIKEGVHDTSFWRRSADSQLFIVQIICCEENVDFEIVMRNLSGDLFLDPDEIVEFKFSSGSIEIFDSAEDGSDVEKKSIITSITPGEYKILSKMYDPDERSSLIIHMFERLR